MKALELEAKGTTLEPLSKLLFGARTEKTSHVLGEEAAGLSAGAPAGTARGTPRLAYSTFSSRRCVHLGRQCGLDGA